MPVLKYYDTASGTYKTLDIGANGLTPGGLAAGAVLPFGGPAAAVPAGWLLCDGSSYPTSAYLELFNVIGYLYGGSGGSFNVPNLKGRVPAGVDAADTDFTALGKIGGGKLHKHPLGDAGQAQFLMAATTPSFYSRRIAAAASWTASLQNSTAVAVAGTTSTQTLGTGLMGTTDDANALPPYLTLNYMICTGVSATAITNNLAVQDENSTVVANASMLDFQGAGVSAALGAAGEAIVTVPGGVPGQTLLTFDHPSQNSGATTGWVRQTGGAITIPEDGLYLVVILENFGAGTAGTVARRGVGVGATAGTGPDADMQHLEFCGVNSGGTISATFMKPLTAGTQLGPWRYTDVANHYSAGGGFMRIAKIGS